MHERKAIRDAVVSALTNATDAGARVIPSRKAPVKGAELPQINVYTLSEETDPDSADTAPVELERHVSLVIDCWSNVAMADMEDALDALALQVETAWDIADDDPDSLLAKATFWSWPASTEMGVIVEGDKPLGCAHMIYAVAYHSDRRSATADAALPALQIADTKFSLENTQTDVRDQAENQKTGMDT